MLAVQQILTKEAYCGELTQRFVFTAEECFDGVLVKVGNDVFYEARNVTGRLTVSMPHTEFLKIKLQKDCPAKLVNGTV